MPPMRQRAMVGRILGMDAYAKDVLVEPEWLVGHLEDESIRIVEVDENPAGYRDAHIPGAIGLDWRRDLQDPVKRQFLEPEDFGRLFGSRGVSNAHRVILYGDRNNWFAAFAYWYLKYYGHEDVKLLNGPRERWLAEGHPTTVELPNHPPVRYVARRADETIRAHRDEVLRALGGPLVLIDVRAPQEYSGELIVLPGYEGEGAQRSGHIPGAKSIPWAQAVNEDGTFKAAGDLRELYAGKGVLTGDPIISYCRIGERSAHTWFVLHELLGERHVKNYDGSWTEWGNLVGVPIERG
jgi:thiosulfate/3-mercaptopyruvate sulfurtransferase